MKLAADCAIFGKEVLQAVKFLHGLGVLQHFENEVLSDIVVINPQWIVDVMACVVSVHSGVIQVLHMLHTQIHTQTQNTYPLLLVAVAV